MKKFLLPILTVLIFAAQGHGVVLNSVVASVGKYAITTYDIKKMNEFIQMNSGIKKSDLNAAFSELVFSYSLVYLSDNDEQIVVREQELKNYVDSITNQQGGGSAPEFYRDNIDLIKLQYRKNQIIRSILSYDQDMKVKMNEEIPEAEMKAFYYKNQKALVEPPNLDVIVFGVVQPKTGGLDELDRFEKSLGAVADALRKSDDAAAIMGKFRSQFNFEGFSGRTGSKNIYDLVRAGYPNEVLGIGLASEPIRGPQGLVTMKKGTVFGPITIVLQGSGKATYLIVKLMNRQMERKMTFEAARPLIDRKLREDRVNNMFKQYVIDKINSGDITVNMLDKNYEGAYNEFVRR
jgi:hypothetical protein